MQEILVMIFPTVSIHTTYTLVLPLENDSIKLICIILRKKIVVLPNMTGGHKKNPALQASLIVRELSEKAKTVCFFGLSLCSRVELDLRNIQFSLIPALKFNVISVLHF